MDKELFERFKKACSEKTEWKVTYSEGGDYAIIFFVAEHGTKYRCLLDSSRFSTSHDLENQLNYIYQHYDVDNEAIFNFETTTEYLRLQECLDDATDIKYALCVLWHISLDLACEDTFPDARRGTEKEFSEALGTMMKGEQK